jgi:hypothetical protein
MTFVGWDRNMPETCRSLADAQQSHRVAVGEAAPEGSQPGREDSDLAFPAGHGRHVVAAMHKSHADSAVMTMRRYWKAARPTSTGAMASSPESPVCWRPAPADWCGRGQPATEYRLVIATRFQAFIAFASQAIAETWSAVSTAAAAL